MNLNELEEYIKNSDNKISLLTQKETLAPRTLSKRAYVELVCEFLSDAEKVAFINSGVEDKEMFQYVLMNIQDEEKKATCIMQNKEQFSSLEEKAKVRILSKIKGKSILQFLQNPSFFKDNDIDAYAISHILKGVEEEVKKVFLSQHSKEVVELGLSLGQVESHIENIEDDEFKQKIAGLYPFSNYLLGRIVASCSPSKKVQLILENPFQFNHRQICQTLARFSPEEVIDFLRTHQDFIEENHIKPYEISSKMPFEMQYAVLGGLLEMVTDENEKRKILATLTPEVKDRIVDETIEPPELKKSLFVQFNGSYVVVDWEDDLQKYRGLDDLITIFGQDITIKQAERLYSVCPNTKVTSKTLPIGKNSTLQEFIEGEKWISSVVAGVDSNWNDIEKIAYVDRCIGKKIGFYPAEETEIENAEDVRSLWKIIANGYGLCNGIADVAQNILERVGIHAEMASSEVHAFLKLCDVEIENESGEVVRGDTLYDPTWNLSRNQFDGRPDNLCVSYETIRKHDMTSSGHDRKSHENHTLEDITLEIGQEALTKAYRTIGVVTREDGKFPVADANEAIQKKIDSVLLPMDKVKVGLKTLESLYPNFAHFQRETTAFLNHNILPFVNLEKAVVDRVYAREDQEKKPVLFLYARDGNNEKQFFYVDESIGRFVNVSQEEFEQRFECYEKDLIALQDRRVWDDGVHTVVEVTQPISSQNIQQEGER